VDGIVLHQLLQWHHMLTGGDEHPATTVAGLEANTVADGLFHAATWVVLFVGVNQMVRLWQHGDVAPSWRVHVGMMLAGWGAFNVVEGLVNHQLFDLHHVRDDLGGPLSWDLGFLGLGLALIVVGLVLVDADRRADRRAVALAGSDRPVEHACARLLRCPLLGPGWRGLAGR